jgi:hypothetical protein
MCKHHDDGCEKYSMLIRDSEDARFIAAAREAVPELLAEIERLRALEGRVKTLPGRWREDADYFAVHGKATTAEISRDLALELEEKLRE